jgi:hypothetical protein
VRSKLFGEQEANYSSYTCYSGLTNFVPPYIDTVGCVTWFSYSLPLLLDLLYVKIMNSYAFLFVCLFQCSV